MTPRFRWNIQGDQSYCPPLKIHDPDYVSKSQWCLVETQPIEKKIAKAQVNCAIPQRDIAILQNVLFSYFWLFWHIFDNWPSSISTINNDTQPNFDDIVLWNCYCYYRMLLSESCVFYILSFDDFLWFSGERFYFSAPI